jgi:hypothetical protein
MEDKIMRNLYRPPGFFGAFFGVTMLLAGFAAVASLLSEIIGDDEDESFGSPCSEQCSFEKKNLTRLHELLESVPNLTKWIEPDLKATKTIEGMMLIASEEGASDYPFFQEVGREYRMSEIMLTPKEVRGFLTGDKELTEALYLFRDALATSQDYHVLIRPEIASVVVLKKNLRMLL